MPKEFTLTSKTGGTLTACSDSNRDAPDYLQWAAGPGCMFGVVPNTPETRAFLEDVLRRFRKDASRLKAKEMNRSFRTLGYNDGLAGKDISTFYDITPPVRRGFKGKRLTESMRAEYEIGWRAGKSDKEKS